MDANVSAQLMAVQMRLVAIQTTLARVEGKIDAILPGVMNTADLKALTKKLAASEKTLRASLESETPPHGV